MIKESGVHVEEQLRRLLGNLPGMAYRCRNEPEWPMDFVSDGCRALTGYSARDLVDCSPEYGALVHERDRESLWASVQTAVRQRRPFEVEYRIIAADGTEKWVWERGVGVLDASGAPRFLEGFISDITARKRAESFARYEVLARVAPVGIFETDASGSCTYVNERWCELTGLSPSQASGRGWELAIHPADRERIATLWQQSATNNTIYRAEFRFQRPDGRTTWVLTQASSFHDDQGVAGYVGGVTDINEAKELEAEITRRLEVKTAALRESEEFYRSIHDHDYDLIFVLDERGVITDVRGATHQMNIAPEEAIGRQGRTLIHEDDRDFAQAVREQAVSTDGSVRRLEFRIQNAHGQWRWREARVINLLAVPAVAGILAISIDIHEEKLAKEDLKTREARLNELVETTQDAVVFIDSAAAITRFNRAAQGIFGYSETEMIGESVKQLMPERYASEHDEYIARYERTGEPHAIGSIRTHVGRRASGEEFPLELSVTELKTDTEVAYAAFIRDISDKVELQKKLLEGERLAAIGTTAATFAHEIGNPLNGMYLNMQLLQRRLARAELPEQAVSSMAVCVSEVERLRDLLSEFRSLSRRQSFHFEPVDVASLLDDVVAGQRADCEAHGVRIESSVLAALPTVHADASKVKQVVLNLCKNSVEAMPEGGELRLEATAIDGSVELRVEDTGSGVPSGVDVFEPFATTKTEGTGLGLAIVKQIMAAHGGWITYETQSGRGTTFVLSLPTRPSHTR